MNLVLGDVLETIYVVEEDDDEEIRVGRHLEVGGFASESNADLTSRPLPRSQRCYLFEVS